MMLIIIQFGIITFTAAPTRVLLFSSRKTYFK